VDRNTWKWIGLFAATFVVGLVGGWLLPDGMNDVAGWFNQPKVTVTPLVRFFSQLLLFTILIALDLMLWLRSQSAKTLGDVQPTVKDALALHSTEMAERAVLRALLPQTAASEEEAAESARLLKQFSAVLASVPAHLMVGYGVLIHKGIVKMSADLANVATKGLEVDVEQHLQITRRFVGSDRPFVQIQRRAYNVDQDWTQEWLNLVDVLGKRSPRPEYIILMPADDLSANRDKIDGMGAHLSAREWSFKCCELERVRDSIGGRLPEDNLDVYGDVAVKLHPPAASYRSRPTFELKLVDLSRDADLRRFIDAVRNYARAPNENWPARVRQDVTTRPSGRGSN
jgi:hypothetical protein